MEKIIKLRNVYSGDTYFTSDKYQPSFIDDKKYLTVWVGEYGEARIRQLKRILAESLVKVPA